MLGVADAGGGPGSQALITCTASSFQLTALWVEEGSAPLYR